MSNHPHRRPDRSRWRPAIPANAAYLHDELDDVCIFCRLTQLVDHLHRRAIPATPNLTDENEATAHAHADQIGRSTNALLELLAGHGRDHP